MTDHLLAAAVDHLAAANWMFACVNSEEGDQPEPPVPVPRPGDTADVDDETEDGADEDDARSARLGPEEPGGGSAPSAVQLARFFG
ncbi:hypothetical protein [Streptomyces sp. T028]|uniref:hypothetical protein n=1 Tax=Streptomyces sp. T028 TaxID=3394379 RepID=UPI003A8796C8